MEEKKEYKTTIANLFINDNEITYKRKNPTKHEINNLSSFSTDSSKYKEESFQLKHSNNPNNYKIETDDNNINKYHHNKPEIHTENDSKRKILKIWRGEIYEPKLIEKSYSNSILQNHDKYDKSILEKFRNLLILSINYK